MLFHWFSFHLYTRLRSLVFVVADLAALTM